MIPPKTKQWKCSLPTHHPKAPNVHVESFRSTHIILVNDARGVPSGQRGADGQHGQRGGAPSPFHQHDGWVGPTSDWYRQQGPGSEQVVSETTAAATGRRGPPLLTPRQVYAPMLVCDYTETSSHLRSYFGYIATMFSICLFLLFLA